MYKSMVKYIMTILALLIVFGCSNTKNSNDKVLAEVGSKKLYLSDVSAVLPNDLDLADSSLMADDYIKKWVKQELMLLKAEENLSSQQKNLEKEIEEYRNSLIIYKYKNNLMAQRMDTTVSETEINDYYENNTDNFKLNTNIVKAIFIKIPDDLSKSGQLKEMCNDTTNTGINELREYCVQYAKLFDIFTDHWVDFRLVTQNLPEQVENSGQFLRQNSVIEMNDSDYYYLVSIVDYKLKNDQAPREYVRDNIKNLILNRRKIDFLKELESTIYSEGLRKNNFKIYNSDETE